MPSAIASVTSSVLSHGLQSTRTTETRAFEESLARVSVRTVEAQRTRLTPDEASRAIREALHRTTGSEPNEQTVALFTAQWAHETAHGASMYNYNFGGIKGTGPTGLTVAQRTKEGWGKTEHSVMDNFRAYESVQEGANDYVRLLTAHYPEAVSAANRGDASGFVRGLKQRGYFTGDERAYERSVSSIATGLLDGNYSVKLPGDSAAAARVNDTSRLNLVASGPELNLPLEVLNPQSLVAPLVPAALVSAISASPEVSESSRNAFSPDQLQAVSALSMADEVVRAALFEHSADANKATQNSPKRSENQWVG